MSIDLMKGFEGLSAQLKTTQGHIERLAVQQGGDLNGKEILKELDSIGCRLTPAQRTHWTQYREACVAQLGRIHLLYVQQKTVWGGLETLFKGVVSADCEYTRACRQLIDHLPPYQEAVDAQNLAQQKKNGLLDQLVTTLESEPGNPCIDDLRAQRREADIELTSAAQQFQDAKRKLNDLQSICERTQEAFAAALGTFQVEVERTAQNPPLPRSL
ncbi:MAG: hypothetical protein KGR16_07815 [Verrucomicrobia bacterium]|nr:hypothetical protein [Verrucomicrobiota bacterium]MDE3047910.1 hypothetical protein [Verrucomicrobiota bacterium]